VGQEENKVDERIFRRLSPGERGTRFLVLRFPFGPPWVLSAGAVLSRLCHWTLDTPALLSRTLALGAHLQTITCCGQGLLCAAPHGIPAPSTEPGTKQKLHESGLNESVKSPKTFFSHREGFTSTSSEAKLRWNQTRRRLQTEREPEIAPAASCGE